MSDWEGKERRSANITLNDLLLELREMKQEFKGDMRLIYERLSNHEKEDKTNFEALSALIKSNTTTVSWLQKGAILVIGGWMVIQFLIQINALPFVDSVRPSDSNSNHSMHRDDDYVGRHKDTSRESLLVRGTTSN